MNVLELFPQRKCWIGTATQGSDRWEVSNGPAGRRSHADSFKSARQAISYARGLGLTVIFEEDFEWGDDRRLFAWHMHGTDDVKLIRADDEEQAARIAIQTRIDVCENNPEAAYSSVVDYDEIWLVDDEKTFTAKDGVWDGPGTVGRRVHRV